MKAILSQSAADAGLPRRRVVRLGLILALLLPCVALNATIFDPAAVAQNKSLSDDEFQLKARYLYDLAVRYVDNGDVDKAVATIRQIIQSPIPPQYEEAVVKTLCDSYFADKLKDLHRFDQSQLLLDDALKIIVQIPHRATILKRKSALYYLAGDNDKAIEFWERAKAELRRKDGNY